MFEKSEMEHYAQLIDYLIIKYTLETAENRDNPVL